MAALDINATLADLFTGQPGLASRLEELGLVYCCGGQRRLVDAVEVAGLGLDEDVGALESVNAEPNAEDRSVLGPVELVDHLEATHNAYLHDTLPRANPIRVMLVEHDTAGDLLDRLRGQLMTTSTPDSQ